MMKLPPLKFIISELIKADTAWWSATYDNGSQMDFILKKCGINDTVWNKNTLCGVSPYKTHT